MGVVGYAAYARSADLGNGVAFYALVGVSAAVLTVAAFGVAAGRGAPAAVTGLLGTAAALSVLHSAATGRAAPTMFQIGRAEDTPAALEPLLTRFARWSAARAIMQAATLIVMAIAVEIYAVLQDIPTFWGQDSEQRWDTVQAELDAAAAGQATQCCGGPAGRQRRCRFLRYLPRMTGQLARS